MVRIEFLLDAKVSVRFETSFYQYFYSACNAFDCVDSAEVCEMVVDDTCMFFIIYLLPIVDVSLCLIEWIYSMWVDGAE